MRQVVISHGQDGYWVAECPSLPGCISQGQTREDAVENIKEAIDDVSAHGPMRKASAASKPPASSDRVR